MFKDDSTDPLLKKYLWTLYVLNPATDMPSLPWGFVWEQDDSGGLFTSPVNSRESLQAELTGQTLHLSSLISSVAVPIVALPMTNPWAVAWPWSLPHDPSTGVRWLHISSTVGFICAYIGHSYFGAWTLTRIFSLTGLASFWKLCPGPISCVLAGMPGK